MNRSTFLAALFVGLWGCAAPDERSQPGPATPSDPVPSGAVPSGTGPSGTGPSDATSPETSSPPLFDDVTAASGLDFVHFNGMAGGFYYSEMMGSGGALFDADGDGDLDLFLVQGAELGGVPAAESTRPPAPSMLPLRDRLYLHEGLGDDGVPQYRDATAASGLDSRGYGMGAVAADFDDDGNVDLYVTNAGPNELWLGRGDGTFERSDDPASRLDEWSVAAIPFDADLDGDLDLFVAHYVDYSISVDKRCTDALGQRNYCGPLAYPPVRDALLRNRGDGTFDDVSLAAGLDAAYGRALGGVAVDLDRDGLLELFVANDGDENQLWRLRTDGRRGSPFAELVYDDRALLWGVAVNATGHAEASMGVALGDADGDGDEDLFVTHLDRETNTLYLSREHLPRHEEDADHRGFDDRSTESGLGAPSFDRTGFGTVFVDWDLDGDLDLPVANGAVKVIAEQSLAGDDYPLHQPNQLFRNVTAPGGSPARFEEVDGPEGAPWTALSEVSRAVLAGDLDDDGDDDLVLTNNAGPARIYRNRAGDGRPWIGAEILNASGTTAHHAVAELVLPSGERRLRHVAVASGYAGSHDPRVRFALASTVDSTADSTEDSTGDTTYEILVRWLGGETERFSGLAPGRYHSLVRGRGEPEDAP